MHTSKFHQANNHLTLCFIIVKITSRFIYFGFLLVFFDFSAVFCTFIRRTRTDEFSFLQPIWIYIPHLIDYYVCANADSYANEQLSLWRGKDGIFPFPSIPETKWSIIFYWFQFQFPSSNPNRMQRKQPAIFPTKSLLLCQINEGCWLYFRPGFNLLVAHKTKLCA